MRGLHDRKQKKYKKLRPLLLPVERWVGLPRGDSSKTIPKKTTPGEILKTPRNHQDGRPYGGPGSPKTKGTKGNKLREAIEMPHVAIITQGQLRTLELDAAAHEGTMQPKKAPVIEARLQGKAQSDKNTSSPTAEATLDKDAWGHKMTDWEYLM